MNPQMISCYNIFSHSPLVLYKSLIFCSFSEVEKEAFVFYVVAYIVVDKKVCLDGEMLK